MMRNLLLLLTLVCFSAIAGAQTSLSGKLIDEETKEPIILCNVVIYNNGVQISGTQTDFDGNYNFSNIDPGTYDVQASYVGYSDARINDVKVLAGKANKLDIALASGVTLGEVVVTDYKVPLVEQDNTTSGAVLTSDQIRNLPTRNINALAATSAGLSSADEGGAITIRGSRSNATNYYVDGIRVQGSLIIESEIDQLQIITGGVESRYGDVTGGIISITSKGPSSKFSGGIEAETSQFFDSYDNSLLGVNLSGPIWKKAGRSILGYRLSGRYTSRVDDDPPAVPVYRIKDAKLAELQANPVIRNQGDQFVAADFLLNQDVEQLDYNPFEESTRLDFTAKLDARISEAVDVTLTGSYADSENQFTPGGGLTTWTLLNSQNNPFANNQTYRGNFRFRHRLGGASVGDGGKGSPIQNASYTLQFGYEKTQGDLSDPRHKDNYFAYGHAGNFNVEFVPIFQSQAVLDTAGNIIGSFLQHADYRQVLRTYDPSTYNPVLSNYNNVLGITSDEVINDSPDYGFVGFGEGGTSLFDFNTINGRTESALANSWGFHTNVGTVYNLSQKTDQDIYTFNANASFDLLPGGSEKGRHNIQLGIAYEQRTQRRYDVYPRELWTVARQLANIHIQGIDPLTADTIGLQTVELDNIEQQVPLLDLTLSAGEDNQFYRNLRDALGFDSYNQFVNVDGLDPSQLSLDMFSAKELNDQQLLYYYGYDYLGNNFDGTFEEFFTFRDPETNVRTFPVAPTRPIYGAAYIQDKFTFKDIIFRLGVRIDRYDANTKVLKDLYSLYDIQNADAYHSAFGGNRPGNIGDEFKVYLTDRNIDNANVLAYRDGDNWYEADGTPANGPQEIAGIREGILNPAYVDPAASESNYIKSNDFDTDASFEDYEVQLNIMPRLAFSFPISEEANFFAHYDILVQRPPSNTIATGLDYFYFYDDNSGAKNNPNLRPEKTIDYEVGFQQKLSNSSALKIAAYYKELRDMIQQRIISPVPVITSYTTFDNFDFGTVKGFSFQYDLRRTGNLSLQANYTLQFADGTGSDANSQRGLNNRGNLRVLFPLNYDERHRLNLTADYRYGSGKYYTGPQWFGADVLSNFGINMQGVAVSGRPYTANRTPSRLGGTGLLGAINGARKPWNFTLNLRVDKTFELKNNLALNVYVRISNVLDRRNVINVYPVTGSPSDDGYLTSSFGKDDLQTIENSRREVENFLASYQWRVVSPDNFSLPRRIFVGASINF